MKAAVFSVIAGVIAGVMTDVTAGVVEKGFIMRYRISGFIN